MTDHADLTMTIRRGNDGGYPVELRVRAPKSDRDAIHNGVAKLDEAGLARLGHDMEAYGQRLSAGFFCDKRVAMHFGKAHAIAQSHGVPLRTRLAIAAGSEHLHGLRWETLCAPDQETLLSTSERALFSRYLETEDFGAVAPRGLSKLKALVAIANPSDLADYNLHPIDVKDELDRARVALGEIPVTPIASGGDATVDGIVDRLRDGHDILYLVCHGTLHDGDDYRLWLEDHEGKVPRAAQGRGIPGSQLSARLRQLPHPPGLVVLGSCHSASGDALSSLGPRMAAGIPAVVAMQESITMKTLQEFMGAFFRELKRHGEIDRAMAVARGDVRDRDDYWVPVLFMNLRSGRIWAEEAEGQTVDSEAPVRKSRAAGTNVSPTGEALVGTAAGSASQPAKTTRSTRRSRALRITLAACVLLVLALLGLAWYGRIQRTDVAYVVLGVALLGIVWYWASKPDHS